MKNLISILLLFCTFVSYSQTSFSDTLESVTNLTRDYLILRPDNTYRFESSDSKFSDTVTGTYIVENNLLILKDTVNHILKDTIFSDCTVIDRNCNVENSVDLMFRISDNNNNNLEGAIILINKLNRGRRTKKDGYGQIISLPKNQELIVRIYLYGYHECKFKIFTNSCKTINIVMKRKKDYDYKLFDKNKYGIIEKFKISNKDIDIEEISIIDELKYIKDRILKSKLSNLTLERQYYHFKDDE